MDKNLKNDIKEMLNGYKDRLYYDLNECCNPRKTKEDKEKWAIANHMSSKHLITEEWLKTDESSEGVLFKVIKHLMLEIIDDYQEFIRNECKSIIMLPKVYKDYIEELDRLIKLKEKITLINN